MRHVLWMVAALVALGGCSMLRAPPPSGPAPPASAPTAPGAQPSAPAPATSPGSAQPPGDTARPPAKEFRLSPAATALVSQAHGQARAGHPELAAATLERALRIEPNNPLLWIELGQLRLDEGNAPQAQALAHKARSMARGDPRAESSAWRLSAAALRAQGRNGEAGEAEHRASALEPR